jgi:hypothetical protein
VFSNQPREPDIIFGFENTPWHAHGSLVVVGGNSEFVNFSPSEVLPSIVDGKLLFCERFLRGELVDRWLVHRDGPMSLKYTESSEEIRIRSFGSVE